MFYPVRNQIAGHEYLCCKLTLDPRLGSAAAAFQAWMYGGFTPASGFFATFTSLTMIGSFTPVIALSGHLSPLW